MWPLQCPTWRGQPSATPRCWAPRCVLSSDPTARVASVPLCLGRAWGGKGWQARLAVPSLAPTLQTRAHTHCDPPGVQVSQPQDVPEHGVRVVFVELPNTKLELLHPLGEVGERRPTGDSPYRGQGAKGGGRTVRQQAPSSQPCCSARQHARRQGARAARARSPPVGGDVARAWSRQPAWGQLPSTLQRLRLQNSPISKFLERNPAGGVHHICLEVGSLALLVPPRRRTAGAGAGPWSSRVDTRQGRPGSHAQQTPLPHRQPAVAPRPAAGGRHSLQSGRSPGQAAGAEPRTQDRRARQPGERGRGGGGRPPLHGQQRPLPRCGPAARAWV